MKKQTNKPLETTHKIIRDLTVDEYGFILSFTQDHTEKNVFPNSSMTANQAKTGTKKDNATRSPRKYHPKAVLKKLPLPMHKVAQCSTLKKPGSETTKVLLHTRQIVPSGGYLFCEICGSKLKSTNLAKHQKKAHKLHEKNTRVGALHHQIEMANSQKKLVKCPQCEASVRIDHLNEHLKRVHAVKLLKTPIATVRVSATADFHRGNDKESVHEDEHDGGKYLGYLARENGKFGSLPLFDDYSDEASAD